jgi:hypothetical protein
VDGCAVHASSRLRQTTPATQSNRPKKKPARAGIKKKKPAGAGIKKKKPAGAGMKKKKPAGAGFKQVFFYGPR